MSEPHFKQKRFQRRSAEAITGSNPVLTTKIKVMKKEKTYFDGIIVGFGITAIIYSALLVLVIRMLTQ